MKPQAIDLKPHDWVPNNPRFPVLVYRAVLADAQDIASEFEVRFTQNQWTGLWRNGVFDYHHYHSNVHEALGIAKGQARLVLGGPGGKEVEVAAGDLLVLPAGTGHCRIAASNDFLVVGAYSTAENYDICRQAPTDAQRNHIACVPVPQTDPLTGESGNLPHLWSTRR